MFTPKVALQASLLLAAVALLTTGCKAKAKQSPRSSLQSSFGSDERPEAPNAANVVAGFLGPDSEQLDAALDRATAHLTGTPSDVGLALIEQGPGVGIISDLDAMARGIIGDQYSDAQRAALGYVISALGDKVPGKTDAIKTSNIVALLNAVHGSDLETKFATLKRLNAWTRRNGLTGPSASKTNSHMQDRFLALVESNKTIAKFLALTYENGEVITADHAGPIVYSIRDAVCWHMTQRNGPPKLSGFPDPRQTMSPAVDALATMFGAYSKVGWQVCQGADTKFSAEINAKFRAAATSLAKDMKSNLGVPGEFRSAPRFEYPRMTIDELNEFIAETKKWEAVIAALGSGSGGYRGKVSFPNGVPLRSLLRLARSAQDQIFPEDILDIGATSSGLSLVINSRGGRMQVQFGN